MGGGSIAASMGGGGSDYSGKTTSGKGVGRSRVFNSIAALSSANEAVGGYGLHTQRGGFIVPALAAVQTAAALKDLFD